MIDIILESFNIGFIITSFYYNHMNFQSVNFFIGSAKPGFCYLSPAISIKYNIK